jgi:LuxR family transcriptional regulator, quorum-sensing system regulator SdiA
MTAARCFGLNHGAIFSRRVGTKKSVLTLAREDREFTDEEIALLSSIFDRLVAEVKLSTSLTQPEIDVLRGLRDGLGHKETADSLNIAVSTVKVPLDRARAKLGAKSSAQTLALAIQQNLL